MYKQTYNDGLHIKMKWVVCPECKGKITKTKPI
nr:MAG TPA: cysteine-rich protein [Caudoviricetes sp.]